MRLLYLLSVLVCYSAYAEEPQVAEQEQVIEFNQSHNRSAVKTQRYYNYQCEGTDGNVYYFSDEPCPKSLITRPFVNLEGDKKRDSSSTSAKVRQSEKMVSEYEELKQRLSADCDHFKYGTRERYDCRVKLKEHFFKRCYADSEMDKLQRTAYCSLAETYPIVE